MECPEMLIPQILLSKQLRALRSWSWSWREGVEGWVVGAAIKVLFQPADGNPSLTAPFERFGCS